MQRYLQQASYVLSRVWFDYHDGHYEGRGVMTWDPDEGFHIEAPVERSGPPLRTISFGGPSIVRESEVRSIRMLRNRSMGWIVAPEVIMRNRFDVLIDQRLSIDVSRAIFSEDAGELAGEQTTWIGSALYRFSGSLVFPDSVDHETRIGDQLIWEGKSRSGILFGSPGGQRVVGRLVNEEYFELSYALPMSEWPRASAWRWAEAAGLALAISAGQTVRLLRREIRRGSRRYIDMRRRTKVESLAPFAPLGQEHRVDRDRFITLSNFLTGDSREANVCRHMFGQMAALTGQRTWQGRELFLATILEAALRTLEGRPFGDRSFRMRPAFTSFQERFFPDSWAEICERAFRTHFRLRDRNAHPDWLYEETGAMSDDRREEALRDMIFLSRFYGQMILALAGIPGLDPEPLR